MYKLILISLTQSALLCGGQVLLKLAVQLFDRSQGWKYFVVHGILTNWYLMGCGVLMTSAALLWMYILKHFEFSVAYPLSSMAFALGAVAGILVFHEDVSWQQWIGILIIMIGCFVVAKY